MVPLGILKLKMFLQAQVCLRRRLVIVKVNLLVLDRPPEPLHKNVIQATSPAIHADGNLPVFQKPSETLRSKLRPLIGVEDLRLLYPQGLVQSLHAERTLQRVGKLPGENISGEPIYDRRQVEKSSSHANVGDS